MTLHRAGAGEIVWRTSLTCESGGCVAIASHKDSILLGNSSDPSSPIATYTRAEWREFVKGIKRGTSTTLPEEVIYLGERRWFRRSPSAMSVLFGENRQLRHTLTNLTENGSLCPAFLSRNLVRGSLREHMQSQVMHERSAWRRSRKCDAGGCVEVHTGLSGVTIRNSSCPTGVSIVVNYEVWQRFLTDIKSGLFDSIPRYAPPDK